MDREANEVKFAVKVGEKEIYLNEDVLRTIHEYIKTPMSLEDLARRLNLESWEEAYDFIKAIPLWVIWTPPSLWGYRAKWVSKEKQP
ncbi:MAG: hypothetical protein QXK88_03445 [Desulfurococcaceae archaeon]